MSLLLILLILLVTFYCNVALQCSYRSVIHRNHLSKSKTVLNSAVDFDGVSSTPITSVQASKDISWTKSYILSLKSRPLVTKVFASSVGYAIGDFIAQNILLKVSQRFK